jgi:hypothetical protein
MKITSKDKTKAKPKAGEKAKAQKSKPVEGTQEELTEKQASEVVGGVRRLN